MYSCVYSRYVLPSRYDISRILKQKEDHMKEKLRHDLPPENGFIAITHDGWTSCATESYDTITAHFINNDWELHSAVLQTCKVEGSHTAQNIAGRLQGTRHLICFHFYKSILKLMLTFNLIRNKYSSVLSCICLSLGQL